MFIGHFAVGFAGKAAVPKTSLGTLFLAAQFLDLLWPTLLLLNVEHATVAPDAANLTPIDFTDYPISHSLLTVLGWGLLFGLVYWWLQKDGRAALVLGLLVVSHWFLDLIVHVPDLPLYPGNSPKVGFGLWNSVAGTVLLEGLLFAGGIWLYLRTKRAAATQASVALWVLVAFLVLVYLANIFGPAPTNMTAVAWAGQLQWLLVVWAYWADRQI
ncbi:hypothetical protein MKJ04_08080 [Pontibacter sp. E15-1]|uniref:hypothetical protein n=1 Tax=Pontibacter sp. E15-1 TaxID=2919918 RepID=UPI001F4FE51F|nr:hypothetical protein [Pontibacter sp. E15-1]MCJ8164799.1 hypothetical protein [Pontibacter sp. E15-1]